MKKGKLLIPMLFMCMVLTAVPAMKSNAEDAEGEQTSSEIQDENSQSQESVTAMDENGNITEVGDSDGVVEDEGSNARARSSSPMIVNFNTKSNETTSYTEDGTGKAGYVNGDYGADAAYLGTSNGKVKFMMSGVIGWVDESEVQVISLDAVEVVSGYEVEDGRLLHCIVYDMTTPGYRSRLDNGEAPSYLTSGQKYYSYDGHYFYTDYETMISDYQNNTRSHSVNPDQPYYNYYQYLPLRSQTLYSGDSLNTMIAAKVSGSSKMSGTGSDFVNAQEAYGVNALLMVSIAGNESAWGTSSIASGKNNLFGLNAVDASPGESADTFSSVQACIEDFACGWMSQSYLDPSSSTYSGGFLGNKGMCKDFLGQFLRESLAEGIAHRGKMGNFVQQSIAQKPTVGQSILNPLLGLAQGWYPKQVLYQHHLDEHYRVCTRPTIVVAVIRLQPLIQPLIIHDLFNLPKQMLFRYQSFQVCYYRLSPGIFSPLFHEYTPISVLYQI